MRRNAAFPFPLPDIGDVVRRRRSAQRMDGIARLSQRSVLRDADVDASRRRALLGAFPWPPRLNLLFFVHRVEGVEPGLYLLQRDAETTARLREMSR